MATTSYSDMDDHQQLMVALQNAADKSLEASDQAVAALEALTEHNGDGLAHADIRATIARMGTVSLADVDNRISQHDENTAAHPQIRESITDLGETVENVRQAIYTAVDNHNISNLSHTDIRAAINQINAQIGDMDYSVLRSEVNALGEEINESIADDIAALKTKDAKHDNKIAINVSAISALQDSIVQNNSVASALSSNGFNVEANDAIKVELAAHKYQVEAGLPAKADNSCSFLNMTTTLPPYIKAGNHSPAETFSVSGIVGNAPSNTVKIKVTAVDSAKLTMTPTSEQDNGAVFSITKVNASAGEVVLIQVTAIDKTSNVTVYKIIGFMVTEALDASNIILTGMPYNVDMGTTYNFTLDNVVDNDNGRYTYAIDSNSTGISFSASLNGAAADISNLSNGSVVNFTVPTNLTGNNVYSFKIVASDIYNAGVTTVKTVSFHVNSIAGAESFAISAPSIVVPGKSYYISWSGLTNEGATDVQIINAATGLTFSDTGANEGILDGAQIKMTVASSVTRGVELPFYISYKDSSGAPQTLNESVTVNTLPVSTNVTCNLTAASGDKISGDDITGGLFSNKQQVKFRLDGGSDVQSGAQITYEVACPLTGVTFSKSTAIAANSTITMTIPKVDKVTATMLKVYVRDATGELSEAKDFAFSVDPIYVTSKPRITSPKNGYKWAYGASNKFSFSAFSYTVDLS